MIIVGIDPGKKGAICVLSVLAGCFPEEYPEDLISIIGLDLCPTIKVGKKPEYNLQKMSDYLCCAAKPDKVFIEKQQPFPKQGVVSTGSLMGGYFAWIMGCVCHGIPYHLVRPQTWKATMLRDMKRDKGSSIIRAKQLDPKINLIPKNGRKENEALAEAYLIARYGTLQNL